MILRSGTCKHENYYLHMYKRNYSKKNCKQYEYKIIYIQCIDNSSNILSTLHEMTEPRHHGVGVRCTLLSATRPLTSGLSAWQHQDRGFVDSCITHDVQCMKNQNHIVIRSHGHGIIANNLRNCYSIKNNASTFLQYSRDISVLATIIFQLRGKLKFR